MGALKIKWLLSVKHLSLKFTQLSQMLLSLAKCCFMFLSVQNFLSIVTKVHISMRTRCSFLLKIFNVHTLFFLSLNFTIAKFRSNFVMKITNVHTLFFLSINFTIAKFRSVFFDENYQRAHVGKFLWNLNYKLYYIAKFISMK